MNMPSAFLPKYDLAPGLERICIRVLWRKLKALDFMSLCLLTTWNACVSFCACVPPHVTWITNLYFGHHGMYLSHIQHSTCSTNHRLLTFPFYELLILIIIIIIIISLTQLCTTRLSLKFGLPILLCTIPNTNPNSSLCYYMRTLCTADLS